MKMERPALYTVDEARKLGSECNVINSCEVSSALPGCTSRRSAEVCTLLLQRFIAEFIYEGGRAALTQGAAGTRLSM